MNKDLMLTSDGSLYVSKVETPFDKGDELKALQIQLDVLQKQCMEAIDLAKESQKQLLFTQQSLNNCVGRMRGLLVQAQNARKKEAK